MNKILITLMALFSYVSIYTFHFTASNGIQIDLNQFRGKKMLIVNTASNSMFTYQYAQMEELYQKYKDSLVVIAFPSNSFNNEPGDDSTIQNFLSSSYNVHFFIASKGNVTGDSIMPVYKWLITGTDNGSMTKLMTNDFQKFLIDEEGNLIAHFNSAIQPMSSDIQDLIQGK